MSSPLRIAAWGAGAGLLLAGASGGAVMWNRARAHEVRRDDPQLQRSGRAWLYHGAPLTGLVIEERADGSEARLPIHDGLLQGTARSWYRNGTLQSKREYLAGQKNGAQGEWWPDGTEKMSAVLAHDIPNGTVDTWYPSGQLNEEHFYIDGHESGHQRVFEADGRLRANYIVRDGRRYGFVNPKPCTDAPDLVEDEVSSEAKP